MTNPHEHTAREGAMTDIRDDLAKALGEVIDWINNWEPNFVEDDEWPKTQERIETALDRYRAAREEEPDLVEAAQCALAQLNADHDPEVAAEMFGGEAEPARAQNINRHDVADMLRAALAKVKP